MHEAFNQTDPKGVADSEMIDAIIRSLILDNDRKFSEILSRLTLPQKELCMLLPKLAWLSKLLLLLLLKNIIFVQQVVYRAPSKNCWNITWFLPRKLLII